ncbi:hypothetical protein [Neobacillus kokaensis]|uniref:DUF4181 domain-containing protein n=1 Tax=Neobacillus kokaensis TaxID=2759023 RepID=A0ABQ3N3C2_9BACI|nr:hypothetical protein [Neobacillus kokaensis]GHH99443.1 hypothetical protein AM1BK_29860 [Neobacillus kokaensis]
MNSFLHKLGKRILKDRIKPFVIIQFILLIIYLIVSNYALKNDSVNFLYLGIGQIIIAIFWALMGVENFLLKKKKYSILWFAISLLWVYLAIQNFDLI